MELEAGEGGRTSEWGRKGRWARRERSRIERRCTEYKIRAKETVFKNQYATKWKPQFSVERERETTEAEFTNVSHVPYETIECV